MDEAMRDEPWSDENGADDVLDELEEAEAAEDAQASTGALLARLADELEWEDLVRRYPIPAVLVAGLGGFILGRTKGDWVLSALSAFAAAQLSRQVNQLLGDEVL